MPADVNKPLCQASFAVMSQCLCMMMSLSKHCEFLKSWLDTLSDVKTTGIFWLIFLEWQHGRKIKLVIEYCPTDTPWGVSFDHQLIIRLLNISMHVIWMVLSETFLPTPLSETFLPTPLSWFLYKPVQNTMKIRWQLLQNFIRHHILEIHGAKIETSDEKLFSSSSCFSYQHLASLKLLPKVIIV